MPTPYSIILIALCLLYNTTLTAQNQRLIDWSELRVDQYECGFPSNSGHSASYYDLHTEGLIFDDVSVTIDHYPEEHLHCASGKIKYQNGGKTYTYSASLQGDSPDNCSYMKISFDEPVYNVSFDLLDIDKARLNNWQDQLTIHPKWDRITSNPNVQVIEDKAMLIGTGSCESQSDECNLSLYFDQPTQSITIEYCYGPDTEDMHPDRQIYNVGNISFTTYEHKPSIEVAATCPYESSEISIEDMWVKEGEKMELLIGNSKQQVSEIHEWIGPKLINESIYHRFTSCGEHQLICRSSKVSDASAKRNELMLNYTDIAKPEYIMDVLIEDDIAPEFTDEYDSHYILDCYDSFSLPEYRSVSDNCSDEAFVHQEYHDVISDDKNTCDYQSYTRYWVLEDACGNITRDTVTVSYLSPIQREQEKVVYSNAFSPNGDGINDELVLNARPDIQMQDIYVYSREGILVYEEKIDNSGMCISQFDTDAARHLVNGVYILKIRIRMRSGYEDWVSGGLTIIR